MLTAASFRPAIAAALAAVGLAALTGCATSFDYATDKPNVIANGGYGTTSDGGLRINGAVIVATAPASGSGPATAGTFSATLTVAPQVNGATVSDTTVTSLALTSLAVDTNNPHFKSGDTVNATFAPRTVRTIGTEISGSLNMADPTYGGIGVTGSFSPGDVIPIKLTLKNGGSVTLEVPVVKACGVYTFVSNKALPATSAEVTAYAGFLTGATPLAPATETAAVGQYECSFPDVRDTQGASPEGTTAATPKPVATAISDPGMLPSVKATATATATAH